MPKPLHPAAKNLTGEIFGSLLVMEHLDRRSSKGEMYWLVKCICGKTKEVRTSKLTQNRVSSCGCRGIIKKKLPGTQGLRKKLKRIRRGEGVLSCSIQKYKTKILEEFLEGTSLSDIASNYKLDFGRVKNFISKYRQSINTAWELETIIKARDEKITAKQMDKALIKKYVQPKLKKVLSSDDSDKLTMEELVYGWSYVHSGSNQVALKESGFLEVLHENDRTPGYQNLLGIFLRKKANVKQYIQTVQQEYVQNTDVNRKYVQSELVKQVEQLKEVVASDEVNMRGRNLLIKSIELLGKSVGSFQDRVVIEDADPNKALDNLIEMAQEQVQVTGQYRIEDV
jgi:hypothetical protein